MLYWSTTTSPEALHGLARLASLAQDSPLPVASRRCASPTMGAHRISGTQPKPSGPRQPYQLGADLLGRCRSQPRKASRHEFDRDERQSDSGGDGIEQQVQHGLRPVSPRFHQLRVTRRQLLTHPTRGRRRARRRRTSPVASSYSLQEVVLGVVQDIREPFRARCSCLSAGSARRSPPPWKQLATSMLARRRIRMTAVHCGSRLKQPPRTRTFLLRRTLPQTGESQHPWR